MSDSRVIDRVSRRTLSRGRIIASLLSFVMLISVVLSPVTRATIQTTEADAVPQPKRIHAEFVPGEVLVRFRSEAIAAGFASGSEEGAAIPLRARGGRQISATIETFDGAEIVRGLRLARVPAADTLQAIEALSARADVLYAEPNYIRRTEATPNDPRFGELYAMQRISAPQAWERTTGSNNIVVAVIDGGVDVSHPDLQGNIWVNPGEVAGDGIDNDGNGFADDVNGWDFFHNDRTVFDGEDGDDHGTHVAGTIAARGNNGAGVSGVNWRASIMSVKVLGEGGGSSVSVLRGYNYVKMMRDRGINVRVTNNSYGGGGKSQAELDAIRQLNASGILFVAAAGNEATDNFSFPHFPSSYDSPNILAVASSTSADTLSSFSNFGPRVVSIGAPGSGILSTVPPSMNGGTQYAVFSGTSMASPHVAGAAALVLSVNPNISVQNLRGVLAYSGDRLASLQEKTTTGRRLNVAAAIESALEAGGVDVTPPAAPTNLEIIQQFGREVNLRWTAPGDDGGAGTVADYDIFFIQPDGVRVPLPVSGGFSVPLAAGSLQSVTVRIPYRSFSGGLELRSYDNAGNFSTAMLPVTVAANAGSDPYVVNILAPEALSTGGTPLNLKGDDVFKENQPLGFSFPYFGENFGTITVSSNGTLYFSRIPRDSTPTRGTFGLDAGSSIQALNGQKMIAAMWDDLRTDRAGGDVFVVQPDASRIIFRWQGTTFDSPLVNGTSRGEQPVNSEVELRSDGTIIMRYGAGQSAPTNTRLFPVVGIGGGEPAAYVVATHTSEQGFKSLTNAATVMFAPRAVAPAPNTPPSVSLTFPYDGAVFATPGNLTMVANATDSDGTVSKVEFFVNSTLIGTVQGNNNPQFAFSWGSAPAAGTYTLTALATDDRGATTTSSPVTLNVSANPIDDAEFFVRQHYADFLNRTPDDAGLAFWINGLNGCASVACRDAKRIDTSAAYFLSGEFQETGYLVYRFYKASFPETPARPRGLPRFAEFLPDTRQVGQGVVVGQPGWEALLESNKVAFAEQFVLREAFVAQYPSSMTAAQFVAALDANTGNSLTQTERDALITELSGNNNASGRASVLRRVAENAEFSRREANGAFVLMQYFGYMRRNPDDAPEETRDFQGYDFWLGKLNEFDGDFRRADMVKAFITSGEYRQRFAP